MSNAKSNCLPLTANHNLDRKFSGNDIILHNVHYTEATSSLTYAMVCTMPDIAYSISVLKLIYDETGILECYKRGFQVY